MKHTIFPGCLIQYRFPEYEKSARFILDALEIQHEFVDSFACCGSQMVESINENELDLIAGRNLALVQAQGINTVITLCGSCTYTLKKTKLELENREKKARVNEELKRINLRYSNGFKIKHLVELLNEKKYLEELKKKIERKMIFNIVFQNPCLLMKPDRIAQIEKKKDELIKNLLIECGAKVLDYEYQDKCCQGTMLAFQGSIGEKLVKLRYDALNKTNASLMIISCPNCQLVYNIFPKSFKIQILPAIFFTQFVGLALGGSFKELGLNRNFDNRKISALLA